MSRIIVALTLLCMAASPAMSEMIEVKNPSFESPALSPGGWGYDVDDWITPPPADQDAFIEYINGFAADGNQHLGMENGIEVWQMLSVAAQPQTVYTLTVAVGNRNLGWNPAGSEARYGLFAGGPAQGLSLLGDDYFDASTIAESSFADQTLVVTTGDVVPSGRLFISLQSTGPVGRAHFDNVRLSAVPVPEPTALALFGLGFLGLVARRRKG
jgi:hypothetical protein